MAEDIQKQILIIEGNPVLRDAYRIRFARAGFLVREAEDGDTAREVMRSSRIDVVLLDLVLPREDGFTFLEKMKAESGSASIPILVLSDVGSSTDRERVKALGVDGHIVKAEHTVEDALQMVQAAIGGHTEREPLAASSTQGPQDTPAMMGPDQLLGEE